jgi:outer membrane immunogenic protein
MRACSLAFGVLIAAVATPSLAQDYRTNTGPSVADFSGFAIGVDAATALSYANDVSLTGPAGGAHIGYNLQSGGLVGGAEADAIFGSISSGSFGAGSFKQDFLSSIRAKAGYAFGSFLAYGTIGWGYSTTSYQDAFGSADKTIDGGVFGVGLEYALTRNVSILGEYLYYDFNDATYTTPFASRSISTSTSLLRVGGSVHF